MDEITESCLGKMLDSKKNKGEYQPYLANINVRWGSFDLNNLSLMRFEPNENDRYGIKYGDLIMCEGGEPGRCAIWRDELPNMKIQKALHRIRPNTNLVDVEYLYYWFLLSGKNDLLRRHFTETTIKHLPGETLKQLVIDLPDMKIQKNISTVLRSIDKKITVNEKINDNLEQQAKLIYDYWFTQFDFPDENGKPYCSSGGKMVWNEQLKRNIPENWKVAQLKDIFNVSGKPISRDDCQTDAYYTPIDVIPKRTITFAGGLSATEANSSLQLYEENNILLGAMRVYFHRVCISAQSGITRTTTLVLKPKADEYLGYAYQVLNDDNAILYATQHSSGTQQPYIKWNDVLENYRFAMPSNPKLLYEYSKISEPLITKAKNCARETEQLRKLRDWLLPMLMNGQATISD